MQRMQKSMILKMTTSTLMPSKHVAFRCTTFKLVASKVALPTGNMRMIQTSPIISFAAKAINDVSIFGQSIESVHHHIFKKYKFRTKSYLLYRNAVDTIDYLGYLKEYKMPDTFFSWFLITELYVWMLMTRLMAEGVEGREMRKNLVGAMWQDAHVRKKQLGNVRDSTVQIHMNEIGHQFNAAVIGYDEGLMSNDKILAGAVWRRFLQSECNDAEVVEELVIYIRETVNMLEKMPFENFLESGTLKWLNHKRCRQFQVL